MKKDCSTFNRTSRQILVKLTKREAIDIDDEEDFLMAESISNLK